jgi:hypothetical protein
MNQESDGARMHRLAAPCEALKGQRRCGRPARIKIGRAELARERSDHPLRPSIERMRLSIPRFPRILKDTPLSAAGEAEQHNGSRLPRPAHCAELTGLRVKGAAHRETEHGGAATQLIEVEHGQA